MNKHIAIIGAGPGGYTAAFLAADLGFKVTLIDENDYIGGTCLKKGCIPAKTLLHAARIITEAKEASDFGITFSAPEININTLREKKNDVISKLTNGLSFLRKKKNIDFIQAKASFIDSTTILVTKKNGSKDEIKFDNAIIATGSKPMTLPGLPESHLILDSTMALEVKDIPGSLLIVGGGYIGAEFGSIYAALGSEVTLVELTGQLLPGTESDLVRVLQSKAKKTFKAIRLNTKVTNVQASDKKIKAMFEDKNGTVEQLQFDKVLVAIGRSPMTSEVGLNNLNVELNNKGFIKVNSKRQTTAPNIYAIGDVTEGPMLAHKASYEAKVAVRSISWEGFTFENKIIPAVVFTDPEIAYCGLSETDAREKNIDVKAVKFPWIASGRSLTNGRSDGFTKLIIDNKTEQVLGVSIVGMGASELISEGVVAIENGLKASDLTKCIHPHPTLSETIYEAGELFDRK